MISIKTCLLDGVRVVSFTRQHTELSLKREYTTKAINEYALNEYASKSKTDLLKDWLKLMQIVIRCHFFAKNSIPKIGRNFGMRAAGNNSEPSLRVCREMRLETMTILDFLLCISHSSIDIGVK